MQWETVIGLEVHVQLKTNSKIFSGAATAYGAAANSQACAIDLGMPGVLPVLNEEVITMAIKLGLAIDATIAPKSVFARKNYFYPDLPKGYQISQFELPIVHDGHLDIKVNNKTKRVGVTRAHLEEDAGKSLHTNFPNMTGIDLNRAGTPLLEVVSEPDMRSAEEAVAYLKTLHSLVCALNICDGNMQEGSFRCDANVSVRLQGEEKLGTRAEIKNVNSFKFVEKAINYEVERQIALLESAGEVVQETRLYDANKNQTRSMRGKEDANDYRYFPDPDLLPVMITQQTIEAVKKTMPELPEAKQQRFMSEYQLSAEDSKQLVMEAGLAHYFETIAKQTEAKPKLIANWLMTELMAALNKHELELSNCPIAPEQFALLLSRIHDATISGNIARTIFQELWEGADNVDDIIETKGLKQVTDTTAIEAVIQEIIDNNPNQVEQYRSGKDKVFGFFVGQVMKVMKGKANPAVVNELLKKRL